MKVGFFVNTYLPIEYGSAISVEYFKKGLEKLGHEVFVFAPRFGDYQDQSKNVIRYPSLMWQYKIKYPLAISFYPPMSKKIAKLKFDLIHCHQPFSVGRDGLRQAHKNQIPAIFTHHCRYEDYTHYVPIIPQSLLRWHVKRRATFFANQCQRVIAPTDEIRQMIVDNGVRTPISVLPTGIDWERYQTGKREDTRNILGIEKADVCMLWVGRMQVEKNLDFLIKALSKAFKSNQKLKMVFVGDGPEKTRLENYCLANKLESKVFFTGHVGQETIQNYYAAADVFLQTSLTETQGMATTEAMAAGLAIAAVRATGAIDLIKDGQTGLLVENDLEKYAQALERLLSNPQEIQCLGNNARQAAKDFDYLEKARELERIYLEEIERLEKS